MRRPRAWCTNSRSDGIPAHVRPQSPESEAPAGEGEAGVTAVVALVVAAAAFIALHALRSDLDAVSAALSFYALGP